MRLFKRTGFIAAGLLIALLILIISRTSSSGFAYKLNDLRQGTALPEGHKRPKLPACVHDNSTYAETWTSLKDKHSHLLENKFTYVPCS